MYGAGDVRVEEVADPKLEQPTDALVRIVRACGCGSDLHPYHQMEASAQGPVRAYLEELLPEVLDGHLEPGRVFDRTMSLDDIPAGYQAMDDRESIKVLVTL